MKRIQTAAHIAAFLGLALATTSVQAFFHFWHFDEIFSNADGTVQFIEMTTTSSGEIFANGVQIRSTSTGKIFTFTGPNLTSPTTNKNLLIATSGFSSLPGLSQTPPLLTPDYTLDANFFNQAGDTLKFCTNPCNTPGTNLYETRIFGAVPTDGVMSLRFLPTVMTDTNSPKNYAGTTGSVNLTPPPPTPTGDYNGDLVVNAADYTVWRNAFGTTVTEMGSGADGHADGVVDDLDYAFWRDNFGVVLAGSGGGAGIVVPEPALLTVALPGLWAFFLAMTRVRRARAGLNRPDCQTSTLKSLHLVNSVSQFLRTLSFVSTWLLAAAWAAAAPTVWTGTTISFAKASGANHTLPANQDHLTASVALTRGSTQGIFNILAGGELHIRQPGRHSLGDFVQQSSRHDRSHQLGRP